MDGQSSHVSDMPTSDLFSEMDMLDEWDAAELEAERRAMLKAEAAQRPLEEQVVLICAEQFQRLGLRLYEGLHEFDGGQKNRWLMIGDGEKQILSVLPLENESAYFTEINGKETPVLHYPANDGVRGKLASLPDYIEMYLRCGNVSGAQQPDLFRPVPPELHAKMGKARLIRPKPESYIWELTPLGAQYGLVHGFLLLAGQKVCHTFFIPAASLGELKELLADSQNIREERNRVPLKDRLSRMAVGLPGKDAYAVGLMKRLGNMPLEQYMSRWPDQLEKLKKELPGEQINTVQEAAARISEIWNTPGCSMEQCKNLIWYLLVAPMLNGMAQFRKFEGSS